MAINNQGKELLAPGHRACPGCGCAIAVRHILFATGPNVVVVSPTGCLETFTSPIDFSAWEVPWVHCLFENAASVASGVLGTLKAKGNPQGVKVLCIGGDGGTYDIGLGSLSGMFERKEEILYICYDNEAYMNTGIQGSSATPYAASTTTTPSGTLSFGKAEPKKDLVQIALAHKVPYVATASIAFPLDLQKKVRRAQSVQGPSYIQILTPCNLGWGFEPQLTIELARKAFQTGLYPILEFQAGQIAEVLRLSKKTLVEEYLKLQGRYRHLFSEAKKYRAQLEEIQSLADSNIEQFNLI